eukprot:gene7478-9189_t
MVESNDSSTPTPTPTTLPNQPPGFRVIFHHILILFGVLAGVILILTLITLIARLTRKRQHYHSKKLSLRTRTEVYLTVTGIIQWIEGIQTVLSVASVLVFVYGTYLPQSTSPPLFYTWLELCLTIFFTLHWMLDYFISKNRLKYLTSFFSIVDLVTVLPIYIDIIMGNFFSEPSTFQFLRVLRTVRTPTPPTIFTFIMIVAAFYMNIDVSPITNESLKFHETIYFLVVTLTTDGYGDIHPTNAVGQLTITFAIVIGAVLIPYQVSQLLETFSSYSPFKRDLSKDNLHGHIILCGDINFTSLLEFLTEFYLEKYGQLKKTIVILSSNPPSDQLKILLLHPFYKNRLYYLEGSPMLENDLKRARFSKSATCFIFKPLYWEEGDSTAILSALAMKNLCSKGTRIFTQLIRHENKYKISSNVKHVMCIEDFRNGILVQSALCPGFGTLVCNLFTSRQPDASNDEEKWVAEYCNGSVNSIYKIAVPMSLIGETLGYVTTLMYSGAKALVLGIVDSKNDIADLNQSYSATAPMSSLGRKHKFQIHPPFSTVLTSSMNLIIIAHSPSAPTFKPNVPSIIRRTDTDEPQDSFFRNLYNKLFFPDELTSFTELKDSTDHLFNDNLKTFFTSTFTNNTNTIEMDNLSTASPSQQPPSPILQNLEILPTPISNNNNNETTTTTTNNQHSNIEENLLEEKVSPLVQLCNNEFNSNWNQLITTVIEESVDSKKAHLESIVEDLEPILESIKRDENLDEYSEEEKEENNWKEHIIICGSINRIDLFLRGLRQKHISDNINHFYYLKNHCIDNSSSVPPIVILHPEEPDMSDWDDIEDIFYVKGSPLERRDLDACKIHLASKIIILSDPYTPHHSSTITDKTSVQLDSDTIMAYLEINEVFQSLPNSSSLLMVELVHEPNIRFISKNFKSSQFKNRARKEDEEFEKPNYYITSEFASGKVLSLTTLDSLLCQASHQEYLLDVATELVLGVNGIKKYHQRFKFTRNNNSSDDDSSDDDYFSSDSDSNESHFNHQHNHHHNHCLLNQINVPEQFHGHTYGELFEGLVHKNILPLGLYRCREITGAPNPYVFTCPPSSTILHENDLVYILYHQHFNSHDNSLANSQQ